jgi:predicted phosphoribosyltransferase
MKPKLITEEAYRDKIYVFKDRSDAGRQLAHKLIEYKDSDTVILAIPSGGVPVASEMAKILNLHMDLILARKMQIPWNTEAGFGAINPDGEVIVNKELVERLGLSKEEINTQKQKTGDILEKRNRLFRGDKPLPEIKSRTVILVDDGLASGYTMLAAIRFVRKRDPQKLVVAVPTGSLRTVEIIAKKSDMLICLNVRSGFSFAVADAYRNWYDLTNEEVISLLSR